MVAFKNMGWLSEISIFMGENKAKRFVPEEPKKPSHLGILSFEIAKIMSRLLSLYKSLSDDEISKLRNVMKSQGIAYLNSKDEGFLLSLACAEMLEDLDKLAAAVARLGQKCIDIGLNRFDLVYTDLKLGIADFGKLEYGSKQTEKRVAKMKRLTGATAGLYSALEALAELEISERKLKQWKNNSPTQLQNANFDHFNQKLEQQRKRVCHFREVSLWSKTFDKSVGLMARLVCIIYARICSVFGPSNPVLSIKDKILPRSGPISSTSKPILVRFYSSKSIFSLHGEHEGLGAEKLAKNNRVFHDAGPSTVGGSGLAMRYANVIQLAEKYLDSAASVDQDERESLYQMLPENLKASVRIKLSKNMKRAQEDELLAAGWRDAMAEIMRWLAPIANDTMKWQWERNFDRMKFDSKPSVLLLQTLHFSDKEKTEAAIAELLVGLSCIYRFENRDCNDHF
ncbi:hypothetical protein Fot_33187 [Forsythia ovata]|uniref:Avr9/Cf-9 rapidly elicited protein 137 n=1 Tax=Forsythia ovata TaxID=205694 RepID=A0ABD1TAE1_9LAMI